MGWRNSPVRARRAASSAPPRCRCARSSKVGKRPGRPGRHRARIAGFLHHPGAVGPAVHQLHPVHAGRTQLQEPVPFLGHGHVKPQPQRLAVNVVLAPASRAAQGRLAPSSICSTVAWRSGPPSTRCARPVTTTEARLSSVMGPGMSCANAAVPQASSHSSTARKRCRRFTRALLQKRSGQTGPRGKKWRVRRQGRQA